QIPGLGGREQKPRWPLCTGPPADQLIEIAEFVALISQHLRDAVGHERVLGIDIEIEHAERHRLRAKTRDDRIIAVERLIWWIRVEPEPPSVAPQIESDQERQPGRQYEDRKSTRLNSS